MTDEELETVKARVTAMHDKYHRMFPLAEIPQAHRDTAALLAEVERLRAYIKSLHAHRQAVIRDMQRDRDELMAENTALRAQVKRLES